MSTMPTPFWILFPKVRVFPTELRCVGKCGWRNCKAGRITSGACGETPATGGSSEVECSYSHTSDLTRALGTGRYAGTYTTLLIEDGEIMSVTQTEHDAVFYEETYASFEWVVENHPVGRGHVLALHRRRNMATWEQYPPKFVAIMEESG